MAASTEVSKTEDGTRLLRWFLRHYPALPQRDFYKLCRGGQIRVNSSRCRGAEILKAGDQIRIPPTLEQYKQEAVKKAEGGDRFSLADLEMLRKCIIHSDDDIVVFNKPAGLAVQGGTGIRKSVDKMTAALFPYDKISLVHRLDRETSGVLVVAKNHRAAQILSMAFQEKTASKHYLALLMGGISPRNGVIDNFIIKGQVVQSDVQTNGGPKPQRAITDYHVIAEVPGQLSWVQFSPKTGRTHQLRLHSAFSLNAPIIGDSLYGRTLKLDGGLDSVISTNNLFLFAYKLSFRHPATGKTMTLRAELPEFMKSVITFLEFEVPE